MENRSENTQEYWDNYWVENMNKKTFFNSLIAIARKYYFAKAFAKFISKNYEVKNKSICEIGSGTGLTLACLKKMGAGKCIGVDYSSEAVKVAREINPSCEFMQGNAFKLENIADKSFDLVYSLGFLEHYTKEEQAEAILEQKRIARECIFIEVPYDIFYLRWLMKLNKIMGRTVTFSDEELFTRKTFSDLGLKGKTILMPTTFFLTIGHFES
jgi:ubiquinone/menaquinone biosynthesis C-methylase UbiE